MAADSRPSPPPSAAPGRAPRWRRRGCFALVLLVLLAAGGLALYTWIALNYSYSQGERAGYVQKFSKKGWICKTWEGEIAMVSLPGTAPEIFPFTVRDEAVARRIEASMGRRVSLTYEQHMGLPTSCFGETAYFVTGVRDVGP
jgi:hypothetical protein